MDDKKRFHEILESLKRLVVIGPAGSKLIARFDPHLASLVEKYSTCSREIVDHIARKQEGDRCSGAK